jgi:regulator of sigma E protease
MSILLLILGVILFVGLVVVHEWGHFIAARRGGVDVEEFGIGFPPKIWGKKVKTKKSKFLFTVNALPLGGFVRLKGENDAAIEPGSFGAAPFGTKVKIMLAGVAMNLVTALVIFTFLALIGMPKLFDNQFTVASDTEVTKEVLVRVDETPENAPAAKAGIQPGDQIVEVDGQKISRGSEVGEIAQANAGQTIPVTVERNGQEQPFQVTVNSENQGDGYLGVGTVQEGVQLQRSTWSAPVVAVGLTGQLTEITLKGLGTVVSSLFQGDTQTASDQVAGPVGIGYVLKQGSEIGINFILFIIGILSLSLAIINVLPIPALDGGRLFVLLIARALRKPLTKEVEERVAFAGFIFIIGLIILITYVDINRFIL